MTEKTPTIATDRAGRLIGPLIEPLMSDTLEYPGALDGFHAALREVLTELDNDPDPAAPGDLLTALATAAAEAMVTSARALAANTGPTEKS